jgi:hypothetical protein
VLGAATFTQDGTYPFDVMHDMIGLHLNHKSDWNLFDVTLWRAYGHGAIPRLRNTLQELKNMVSTGSEQGQ